MTRNFHIALFWGATLSAVEALTKPHRGHLSRSMNNKPAAFLRRHVGASTSLRARVREHRYKKSGALAASWQERLRGRILTTVHDAQVRRTAGLIAEALAGVILIYLSVTVMWLNERRNARIESLISIASNQCVSTKKAQPENRGELVHVTGEARSMSPIADGRFRNVVFSANCLRLKTTVEVFQWVQHAHTTEKKDLVGGGTTRTTTYTYTQEWSTHRHDSGSFKQKDKQNKFLVNPGVEEKTCDRVEFGDDFMAPENLVQQLDDYVSAHDHLDSSVTAAVGGVKCVRRGAWFLSGSGSEVGDVRVKFDIVCDGLATVMSLQVANERAGEKETFAPYRMISGRIGKAVRQQRLIAESRKDSIELPGEDDSSWVVLALCCCLPGMRHFVNSCFPSAVAPQIHHMFSGVMSPGKCISVIQAENPIMVWMIRLVSWVGLCAGVTALFSPFVAFVDIMPLLGPLASSLGIGSFLLLCLLVTLIGVLLVLTLAYMPYSPLLATVYLLLAAGIIIASLVTSKRLI
mmetsp:Transcript_35244/g.76993  ORF Transcript_35244/g.76993 Transcript_35244/m.76993 type:complete len:520 (+) Transcript_35244:61-1620(+)